MSADGNRYDTYFQARAGCRNGRHSIIDLSADPTWSMDENIDNTQLLLYLLTLQHKRRYATHWRPRVTLKHVNTVVSCRTCPLGRWTWFIPVGSLLNMRASLIQNHII